jgi:predicted RNase H-like nuclease (RuvC/YqgF family)
VKRKPSKAYLAQERRIKRMTPAKKLANAIHLGEQLSVANAQLVGDLQAAKDTIERLGNHCKDLETAKAEADKLLGPYGGRLKDLEAAIKGKALALSTAEVRLAKIEKLEAELVRTRDELTELKRCRSKKASHAKPSRPTSKNYKSRQPARRKVGRSNKRSRSR